MSNLTKISKLFCLNLIVVFALAGCGEPGDNYDGGGYDQSIQLKLDMSSSKGAVVTDGSANVSASVAQIHAANAKYLGINPTFSVASQPLFSTFGSTTGATFYKVDSDGEVTPALQGDCDNADEMLTDSTAQCEQSGSTIELPQVKNIAINGDQVYFLFTQNFIFRDTDDDGNECTDPWNWASPCSCQIFKARDDLSDMQSSIAEPELGNLECVDSYHVINSWGPTASNPFQFDSAGNMYFYGQMPDSSQSVLYKVDKNKQSDGSFNLTEKINANICVRDYRVTASGGIFYIGENCIDGQWGGGDGSFFRYAGSDGTLKQISQGWWEYIFEPIEDTTSDKVLFYGPDPDSAQIAQWDSACLYEWDPSQTAGSRATRLVTCNNHIWEWLEVRRTVDLAEFGSHDGGYIERWQTPDIEDESTDATGLSNYLRYMDEFNRRCTVGNTETFIGGGTGLPVKNVKQTTGGDSYIVANVNLKNEGTFRCSVNIRGPYCKIDNIPVIRDASGDYNSTTCSDQGGTWVTKGWCNGDDGDPWLYQDDEAGCLASGITNVSFTYEEWGDWFDNIEYKPDISSDSGNITGHICLDMMDNTSDSYYKTRNWWDIDRSGTTPSTLQYTVPWFDCSEPSSGWTTAYKGMAFVNRTTNQLELRSDTYEQVSDMWLVSDIFYYTAFNSSLGQYVFIKENSGAANDSLLTDFEVYHVADSPKTGSQVLFDGLDFSQNSYIFGDLDPNAADVAASINQTTGLTGRVQTMVTYD